MVSSPLQAICRLISLERRYRALGLLKSKVLGRDFECQAIYEVPSKVLSTIDLGECLNLAYDLVDSELRTNAERCKYV